jgi:hypothetical protein
MNTSQLPALEAIYRQDAYGVHILAMAAGAEVIPPPGSYPAPPLDMKSLREAARIMDGTVTEVTADRRDVEKLSSSIDSSIRSAPAQEGQRWKDEGYYLLIFLALIVLTFFRQGGSVTAE